MRKQNFLRICIEKGRLLGFTFVFILICIGLHSNLNLIQAQPSKTSSIPEKIRIAHATPFNSMPIYAAVEKGYFKGKLDVSLQGFPTGRDALNESLKGNADVATVAETPFMYEVMNGVQASIIATISETTNSILIIGRKDKGIIRPVDLKGKKIGVMIGTGGEFYLDHVLVFNGISRTGVKKVNLPPEKMLSPLLSGEVDAVVSWEPYAQELLDATAAKGFAYYGSPTYNRYTWNLVAQRGWVLKNPETVKKMLQALILGVKFIKKNPSGVHKILAGYTRMDESAMSRMWGSTVFKVALNPSLLMSLEDNARWAIRSKRIDAKTVPNFLNYIYFDGLTAVDPAAVTIAR